MPKFIAIVSHFSFGDKQLSQLIQKTISLPNWKATEYKSIKIDSLTVEIKKIISKP